METSSVSNNRANSYMNAVIHEGPDSHTDALWVKRLCVSRGVDGLAAAGVAFKCHDPPGSLKRLRGVHEPWRACTSAAAGVTLPSVRTPPAQAALEIVGVGPRSGEPEQSCGLLQLKLV